MHYRRLGRSGLKVSEISLGAWVTFGNQVDEQTASDLIHAAYDQGINYLRQCRYVRQRPGRDRDGQGHQRPAARGAGHLQQGLLADHARPQRARPVAQAHHRIGARSRCKPPGTWITSTCISATATTRIPRWKRWSAP